MRTYLLTVLSLGMSMILFSPGFASEEAANQLREKAEAVIRQARELKENGNEAEARELFEKAEHMMREAKEMGQRREREGDQRVEINERLEHLKREYTELMEAGRKEDAERVKHQAMELAQHLKNIDMQQQMAEVEKRIHALREAGKVEEAEHLEREVRAKIQEMREQRGERERPEPRGPEEDERRMHHLGVAIDNLRAAGLHDQAEELKHQAERIAHETRERREPGPDMNAHLRELHEAVNHLNQRLERLERAVHEILESRD